MKSNRIRRFGRTGKAILGLTGAILMTWFSSASASEEARRPCAGAGRWFPGDPIALRTMVQGFLDDAEAPRPEGRVVAVIAPHAGYVFSGPAAGEVYRTVADRKDIERIVSLAFSHSTPIRGLSVNDVGIYETPLGDIQVDRAAVKSLLEHPLFSTVRRAHATEHSDENQLPFLQVALGSSFRLVPIHVGHLNDADFAAAAEALRPLLDEHTLVVVSSDFTHYGEAYGFDPFEGRDVKRRMRELDQGAIDRILAKDFAGFRRYIGETGATLCGVQPISLLLHLLSPTAQGRLLSYQTSADIGGGDYSMAVGYAAIVFTDDDATTPAAARTPTPPATEQPPAATPAPPATPAPTPDPEGPAAELIELDLLAPEEALTLLRLARRTLERAFEQDPPNQQPALAPGELAAFAITETLRRDDFGVFVTLKIDGELRGCIGYIVGREPLFRATMQNALNAAFNDPRFQPLTAREFERVHLDISVLSPPEDTPPDAVVVGRDGLVIQGRGRSGVLLPQVPVEQGWTRTEYLDYLCRKAGLPVGAWRDTKTIRLLRFGAQVVEE